MARLLLDWFYDSGALAAEAARETLRAYRTTGAPGRIAGVGNRPGDVFGLFIASRLNFLRRQVRIATDPKNEERHHDWAVREIDEALRLLPTPPVFTRIAEIDRSIDPG